MVFDTPILLVWFNRPDNASRVFDQIKKLKPSKLYVAIDGPREGNITDQIGTDGCKRLLSEIDWPCNLQTLIREKNAGCGLGVSSAISWFFEQEEMGIILEDDCVPAQSFFPYCQEMLLKYRDDEQIMHIAGTRWNEEYVTESSYLFSSISHIWGWATWRRAWNKYDFEMKRWSELVQSEQIKKHFRNPDNVTYWVKTLDRFFNDSNKHTWDYQWQYTLFLHNGISINPSNNLIQNIGTSGSHESNSINFRKIYFRNVDKEYKPSKKPTIIEPDIRFNDYHTKKFFRWRPPIIYRAYKRLHKIVSK
ncbi:nucleotide-diphospho-sugar transferase [Spirosoma sordidisoli]|uniref:Nucleotide-diphospho-sugar transferase n=1 Tax=Spirosoma sordidisoli TaxID=2502893 RepID=A0A4Q2UP61_9BACT|nr:nucleotide-diphospho-sugar transferase [Spirosoma sordidisoli]RYC71473.1 nucleotide-diphospho-sugar transferase [Spirosoma sordidisoli]